MQAQKGGEILSPTHSAPSTRKEDSAVLLPLKNRYSLYRWLGGTRSQYGRQEKSRLYRDSIPGRFSPWRVSMPT